MDWFDEVIGKILKVKGHQKLVYTTNLIKEHIGGPSKTTEYFTR